MLSHCTALRWCCSMDKVKTFDVRSLEVLVLDEADRCARPARLAIPIDHCCLSRLLDMGFELSLTSILKRLPKQRRTVQLCATLLENLTIFGIPIGPVFCDANDASEGARARRSAQPDADRRQGREQSRRRGAATRHPENVNAAQIARRTPVLNVGSRARSLRNWFVTLPTDLKLAHLVRFLSAHRSDKIIVFFLTCACVDYFAKVGSSPRAVLLLSVLNNRIESGARAIDRAEGQRCADYRAARQNESQEARACVSFHSRSSLRNPTLSLGLQHRRV